MRVQVNDKEWANSAPEMSQTIREAKWPVLEKAQERVEAGQTGYGSPLKNFKTVASMLNALGFTRSERPLDIADVPAIMIVLKLARDATGEQKLDNWVDIAGYAACAGAVFDDFSI